MVLNQGWGHQGSSLSICLQSSLHIASAGELGLGKRVGDFSGPQYPYLKNGENIGCSAGLWEGSNVWMRVVTQLGFPGKSAEGVGETKNTWCWGRDWPAAATASAAGRRGTPASFPAATQWRHLGTAGDGSEGECRRIRAGRYL